MGLTASTPGQSTRSSRKRRSSPSRSRSKQMSLVHGRGNKSTELKLLDILKGSRISGWRRHVAIQGAGRPDFVFRANKLVIFVDGCFWHRCPACNRRVPVQNREFWIEKLNANVERDRRANCALKASGWHVLRIWEHALTNERRVSARILHALRRS